jgi:uncharacterized OB-fold protein
MTGEASNAGPAVLDAPLDMSGAQPRLVGGRCARCGTACFPLRRACPECGYEVARTLLPATGTLWTWTSQGFLPGPPYDPGNQDFVPFAVGYVEFDGFLRVAGPLVECDIGRIRIGAPMRVVPRPVASTLGYAFAFAEEAP